MEGNGRGERGDGKGRGKWKEREGNVRSRHCFYLANRALHVICSENNILYSSLFYMTILNTQIRISYQHP